LFVSIPYLISFLRSKNNKKNEQRQNGHEQVKEEKIPVEQKIVMDSVNYFYTRRCNYSCGFCFHTQSTVDYFPPKKAKEGLRMLAEGGMKKINFSGGEPFIVDNGNHLGELVKFCKVELKLESCSVVSNGSLVKEKWF
jgi:radical S-adenosyl methionine domain-containing protein 2